MVARKNAALPTASSTTKESRSASRSRLDEPELPSLRERLRLLYFGKNETAHRFRYGLLVFDIVTILFIIGTSFVSRAPWVEWLDLVFGLLILADFCARLYVSRHPVREFAHPSTWADMVAIFSFLAPVAGEGLGFLRILRTLRLLHTYQLIARLRADSSFFRRNEEAIVAVANLGVFLFIMTGVVYESEHWTQSRDRQLCRCSLFHRINANYHGLRRHHARRVAGSAHCRAHNDLRGDAFPAAVASTAPPSEDTIPLSILRARASRSGRGSLQGLWQATQDPR